MEARPCNSKDSLCIVMFGERSPNIMYSDVWWPFTKHHYTQWILWFWGSESKDSLCIVMFGERSPNIMYSDVWWAFTKHPKAARVDTWTTLEICPPPGPNARRDEISPFRGTPHSDIRFSPQFSIVDGVAEQLFLYCVFLGSVLCKV